MAISTAQVQYEIDTLERDFRRAMDYHLSQGDSFEMAHIEQAYQKRMQDIKRKYDMGNYDLYGQQMRDPRQLYGAASELGTMNAAQNKLMQNVANGAMAQGVPLKSAEEKNGVLMFRGGELPDKWMGAHYSRVARVPIGRQWKISFSSEFSSDTIMLWLSMDEFSGNDADKVAATYLETINQRRLG